MKARHLAPELLAGRRRIAFGWAAADDFAVPQMSAW